MDAKALSQAVERMRVFIRREVAAGFDDADSIAESAVEVFSDECDGDLLRPHALALTREAVEAHRREQATWPAVTDCDRLDAAFVELERGGIVARQNFTCCGTCGQAEIGAEMRDAEVAGCPVRGYVFYHIQCTESAVDGHGLYLHYGATAEGKKATAAIGEAVVKVLDRHGLKAEWNGQPSQCVLVNLDWKRRRVA
jgi:hypothetical protein